VYETFTGPGNGPSLQLLTYGHHAGPGGLPFSFGGRLMARDARFLLGHRPMVSRSQWPEPSTKETDGPARSSAPGLGTAPPDFTRRPSPLERDPLSAMSPDRGWA